MNALFGGAIGSLTTNVLHEVTRRQTAEAPRVDLLGMQVVAKLTSIRTSPPRGRALYTVTLAGDILSNTAYFAAIGIFPRRQAPLNGLLLGALAGIGAVVLPPRLRLAETPTGRTTATKLLTIALYAAGGLATGLALREEAH